MIKGEYTTERTKPITSEADVEKARKTTVARVIIEDDGEPKEFKFSTLRFVGILSENHNVNGAPNKDSDDEDAIVCGGTGLANAEKDAVLLNLMAKIFSKESVAIATLLIQSGEMDGGLN